MKRVRMRLLLAFTLIMIMCWALTDIIVYGMGSYMELLNDTGSSPGSWTKTVNGLGTASSLENGPSSGNPGSFYYFINSSNGTREMGSAIVERKVMFNADQKKISSLQQMQLDYFLNYYGWSDSNDRFAVYIYSIVESGGASSLLYASDYCYADKFWRTLADTYITIPKDTIGIRMEIYADRESGSDLDIYLDNIRLYLYDEILPAMTGATVIEIRDLSNDVVPLKKDPITGEYLENWVNAKDTIYGEINFSEPVAVSNWPYNLNTNVTDEGNTMIYGNIGDGSGSFSTSHGYRIPLEYAFKLREGDSKVKLVDSTTFGFEFGPFDFPVADLGGNHGPVNKVEFDTELNLEKYNLKLDTAAPFVTTPDDSFEEYEFGRSSVDINVCEYDRGTEQSPLTITYQWQYKNTEGEVETLEKQVPLVGSNDEEDKDPNNTFYKATINVPYGDNIPPCQDFWLYAMVQDEARNIYGPNRGIYCRVNQKDGTPPVITWDKSIHEDGTEVDISMTEDMAYIKSRTVSFSVEDLESGVEEVRYLWTKETYDADSDIITKMVMPGEDGKYEVQGISADAPLEGLYYLNILATNATETSCVVSKGFYFDNEAPRVTYDYMYDDGVVSSQEHVYDRALQNNFLYTILYSEIADFEPVVEPDISVGLKDDGMWKVMEMDITGGTEGTPYMAGVLDKITQSGYYRMVRRFYDENYNYKEITDSLTYDFIPPTLEVISDGEPGTFKKNHEVEFQIIDNISQVESFSINWVDADSGEEISEIPVINPQTRWITVRGSEAFNGKYYLKVKARDGAGNVMDEIVFIGGSRAEFCFDNSPPEVALSYDSENTSSTVRFTYSRLNDAYTDVSSFSYGISASPEIEPSEWINITDTVSAGGEVAYPYKVAADGEWYLSVMLQDTLGNEQIIRKSEPFRVDVTGPLGNIDFVSGYTNKLDAALSLEIDELIETEKRTFKTILSGDSAKLSNEAIAGVLPTEWKDITFEKGLAAYNWKLSDIPDGVQKVYARFMDEVGNMSGIYEASIILGRTAPTGAVAYDITTPTAGNVTATLTTDDETNAILNNNQESTYVFNRNGKFEFIFIDQAGNKGRVMAEVNNIDRDPPKAIITYSLPRDVWTNKSITATIQLEDINGYTVTSAGGDTHTFDENGVHVFLFKDDFGNEGSMKAEVKNIDKAAPVGSIIYTNSDTAPVTVYLSVYEPVEVTNDVVSFRHVFDNNGTYKFTFEDKAGNQGEAAAVVNTITSKDKYANINYSDSGMLTNDNISADFTASSGLSCITSPTVTDEVYGSYTYSFTENGDWPVYIRVLSGEEEDDIRTVVGSVYNIDRVPPMAEVYINNEEITNQNLTATLLPYDDKGKTITIVGGESKHVFEKNGNFTFYFNDEAGNTGQKTIEVKNIDKSAPIAGIKYFTNVSKENSVFAEVYFPGETEEVEILNNNGLNTFEFVENGTFTFKYADTAGNEGYAAAQVTSLSDIASVGTIEYYIEGNIAADPNAALTNKNVTAKLVLDKSGGPYTIVNNGGSSTFTFEQNGEFTFVYEDVRKNRGFVTAKISAIDKETPKLQILADIVKATNKDVTVSVSYSDNEVISKVMLNGEEVGTTPEGKLTYICTENKTIQVTVSDTAGNVTTKEFVVNYIDREAPIGAIVYTPSSITNQDVRAVLTMNEPGRVLNNSGRMEYVFTQNGDFTFEFADTAGNSKTMTASVSWIDKLPPVVSLEYSNTSMTNKPVVVTLKTEENAVILNNGGAEKRTFYANGEYTFRVRDNAGNEVDKTAEVGNIDVRKPQLILNGLSYFCIFQNEAYTEPGYTASDNIDGYITSKVVAEGSVNTKVPGMYILKYKVSDAVGNSSEESRTVKVVGPDELVLILNGRLMDGERVIVSDSSINVDCIGNEGSCTIKWAEGKRTQSYFKNEGNKIAAKGTVVLRNNSWFTFFIQDMERKTKSIQVYINE